MKDEPAAAGLAEELRVAFDASFAETPAQGHSTSGAFLAIRVADRPCLIDLVEVSGLFADKVITALPSTSSELLGVAGLRGQVVPVFSLARLLGHGAGAPQPRWLAVANAREVAAFAFEHVEAHLHVARDNIVAAPPGSGQQQEGTVAVVDGEHRSIISLASLVEAISNRN